MRRLTRVSRHLGSLISRPSVEEEVDSELDFHVEMRTREYVGRGMDRMEARAEALRLFGDIEAVNATCRAIGSQREKEMRRTELLAELRQDVGFAVRQLRKTPAFTLVAVLTLALGIGATTAIFSVVNTVVLRPFAFPNPERVMMVTETWRDNIGSYSVGNFADTRAQSTVFQHLAAVQWSSFNLSEGDAPERLIGNRVSDGYFAVFGGRPQLGRVFPPEEDRPGNEVVVVLSHRLWQRRFGGDPRVVFEHLAEELRTAPGVHAAAVTSQAPLGGGGGSNGLVPEGRTFDPANSIEARLRIITPAYFQTLRIPLKQGRLFTDQDKRGAPRVMIISERLAQLSWPGENPIGKRMYCCEGPPAAEKIVVGVVGDLRSRGPSVEIQPEFYLPIEQAPTEAWDWIQRTMTVVARGQDAAVVTGAMREAVRRVDPTLPLFSVATMEERLRESLAQARFNTLLLGALGAIGLVLSAVGIYGVIAYFVSQRSHEIGIRMALGATAGDVLALLARQGLRLVVIGVVVGLALAFAATRVLRSTVQGISVTDPLTFVAVVVVLIGVGLLATLIPARRATRVDPTRALHSA